MNDQSAVHKSILVKIIKDVYSDSILGKSLGFKGGTAAYLCYGLPRTSVDLDFDLLLNDQKDYVWTKMGKIVAGYGTIIDSYQKRNTIFFLVQYQKGSWHIKIEISLRPTIAKFEAYSYLGIPLLVMNKQSMISSKMSALLNRTKFASRDMFDLWFFLSQDWVIDEAVLTEKTGHTLKIAIRDIIKKISLVPENKLLQGMGELLTEKQAGWVKSNLKKELSFLLNLYLENHHNSL